MENVLFLSVRLDTDMELSETEWNVGSAIGEQEVTRKF